MPFARSLEPLKRPERGLTPPGTLIYAIGDIHGRLDCLADLLDRIERDEEGAEAARRVLIFLGDYVDRGPESAGVLERLSRMEAAAPIFLKGNHEEMMLGFLEDPGLGSLWLTNGGDATLASYGLAAGTDYPALAQSLARTLPPAHRDFLGKLKSWHVEGDYLFVHAGLRPGLPLALQEAEDLLWIRQPFLASLADHGFRVVHGHTWTPEPEIRPNRIGIDTGAYRTGRLTALACLGERRWFLHSGAKA